MDSEALQRMFRVLDDLESGGYDDLMNYSIVRQLLSCPQSALIRLFGHVLDRRPQMDLLNLVCTVNGALCYTAVNLMSIDEALYLFDNAEDFDEFVARYSRQIQEIALTRSNNPTIPQRAFSVSCHLPDVDAEEIGLLELGCSRGDIGLVLLNLAEVLDTPSRYLFPDFMATVSIEKLQRARPITRYFGIDLDISLDDAWLLSLWGLCDNRRIQLQNFYKDFKPKETSRFRRLRADACNPSAYLDAVLEFFNTVRVTVILTSFMVYQLSPEARATLARTIRMLQARFLEIRDNDRSTIWLNQGMHPEILMTGEFDFARCYLSKLWFDRDVLLGLPLARLFNDACEGWDQLDASPVIMG